MIWFILSLIAMAGIAFGIFVLNDDNSKKGILKYLWCLTGLLILIPGCISTVATGEVGIKTTWGKITGTNLKEGVQVKAPWQKIIKMNIKVQKYENETAMETSTKDMQVVNSIVVSVNYQLDEDKAVNMYRAVGADYNTIVLEPAIQESIKSTISQFNAEELVTKRTEVSHLICQVLAEKVANYGLKVLDVSIKNFDFSAEYNASIEKKTIAEQNALTAKQELEISKAEAEKKKVEAQGEAEANKIKEQTITDKILVQQWIEKWDGKLPTVSGDSTSMIDINELLK